VPFLEWPVHLSCVDITEENCTQDLRHQTNYELGQKYELIFVKLSFPTFIECLEYGFMHHLCPLLPFLSPLRHSYLHLTHKSVDLKKKKHQRSIQRVPRNNFFKLLSSTDVPSSLRRSPTAEVYCVPNHDLKTLNSLFGFSHIYYAHIFILLSNITGRKLPSLCAWMSSYSGLGTLIQNL